MNMESLLNGLKSATNTAATGIQSVATKVFGSVVSSVKWLGRTIAAIPSRTAELAGPTVQKVGNFAKTAFANGTALAKAHPWIVAGVVTVGVAAAGYGLFHHFKKSHNI